MARHINLPQLRTFIAIADTGTMTKAVEKVNLTQSAASQQIAKLEEALGVKLLERNTNKVTLSNHGKLLYSCGRELLMLNDRILENLGEASKAVEIKLGVPHDLVEVFIPPILREFGETHPHVTVTLSSLSSWKLFEQYTIGKLDMALVTDPVGTNRGEVLLEDELVWVGARDGKASQAWPIMVTLGGDGCQFSEPIADALMRSGIEWQSTHHIGGLGSVFASLAADREIAPLLSSTVPSFLAVQRSATLPKLPHFQISLVGASVSKSLEQAALAKQIKNYFSKLSVHVK